MKSNIIKCYIILSLFFINSIYLSCTSYKVNKTGDAARTIKVKYSTSSGASWGTKGVFQEIHKLETGQEVFCIHPHKNNSKNIKYVGSINLSKDCSSNNESTLCGLASVYQNLYNSNKISNEHTTIALRLYAAYAYKVNLDSFADFWNTNKYGASYDKPLRNFYERTVSEILNNNYDGKSTTANDKYFSSMSGYDVLEYAVKSLNNVRNNNVSLKNATIPSYTLKSQNNITLDNKNSFEVNITANNFIPSCNQISVSSALPITKTCSKDGNNIKLKFEVDYDKLPSDNFANINITFNNVSYTETTTILDYYYPNSDNNYHQFFVRPYISTNNLTTNLQLNYYVKAKTCQDCQIGNIEQNVMKTCVSNKESKSTYKDPSLCSLISNCGNNVKNGAEAYLYNKSTMQQKGCQIYCSDEVEFKFYKDIAGQKYAMSGRIFQFDVTGNKKTGKIPLYSVVANVTRRCVSKIIDKTKAQNNKDICYNLNLSSIENMGCEKDVFISYDAHDEPIKLSVDVTNITSENSKLSYTTKKYDDSTVCGNTCESGNNNNFNNMTPGTSTNATFVKREITRTYSYYASDDYWVESYSGDVVLGGKRNQINSYTQLPLYSYPIKRDYLPVEEKTCQVTEATKDMDVSLKFNNGTCYGAKRNADEFGLQGTLYSCPIDVRNKLLSIDCTCDDVCICEDCIPSDDKGLSFFYRTIELTKVFPNSRKDGTTTVMGENWGDALYGTNPTINLDKFQSEYSNTSVWQKTPEYTVIINPGGVSEIRQYNDSVKGDYTNNTIKCDIKNGEVGYCESSFIDKIEKTSDKELDNVTIIKDKNDAHKKNVYQYKY